MPMARCGEAQCTARLATLIRRRGQASQRAHVLGRLHIPPGKTGHPVEPRALHPDPSPQEALTDLGEPRVLTAAHERPPLGLQRLEGRREQADLLPRALEAGPQGGRQGRTIPLLPRLALGFHSALQRALHTRARQEPCEAIAHPRSVPCRWRQCTMERLAIFLGHAGSPHDTPDLLLPCHVAPQPRQALGDSEPIRLGPAWTAMDRKTGRVDDEVLDAMGHEGAVEPAPGAAGLGATHDAGILGQAKPLLCPSDLLR
jgi:hypothetical protein